MASNRNAAPRSFRAQLRGPENFFWGGRPLKIVVHSAGESTEQTDVMELIHDTWLNLGIKIFTKPSQREVFRERLYSGEALMSIWTGLDNGLPT